MTDSAVRERAISSVRFVLPHSVLVDRSGRVRYVHQGYRPGDESSLEQKILALLEETETKPGPKTLVQANESFLLRLPTVSFFMSMTAQSSTFTTDPMK